MRLHSLKVFQHQLGRSISIQSNYCTLLSTSSTGCPLFFTRFTCYAMLDSVIYCYSGTLVRHRNTETVDVDCLRVLDSRHYLSFKIVPMFLGELWSRIKYCSRHVAETHAELPRSG